MCIRVEHDRNPDLVRRYQVQALPDLRLIDAGGHEVTRLLGFTSAPRLAAQCKALLDRTAGDGRATSSPTPASPVAVGPASKETIDRAVDRGIGFLRKNWRNSTPSAPGFGAEELELFALATSGLDPGDEDVAGLAKLALERPLSGTYQAAFRALAIARLDSRHLEEPLRACARFLLESQLPNGQWTYRPDPSLPPDALGDNSNTAYGLLGLAACRHAGIEVGLEAVRRTEAWWRRCQNRDGGWGYRMDRETASYASMTESGVGSLLLCARLLARDGTLDPDVDRALSWLGAHFSVSENRESVYQEGRLLYHLFALERVGTLGGERDVAGRDWFGEGARFLVASQRADGSWDDGAGMPLVNTSFALLFLRRATEVVR
ncbi:MAG TPA: hypothetical protein VFI25_01950 [Planctomycetota bacterium]|nr:hypothetical protein [Planctomycetota bacterium]